MLVAVLVLVALGGLAWVLFFRGEPEPVYRGKTLSYWFRQYCRSVAYPRRDFASPEYEATVKALRELGTNAVPYLVAQCLSKNQDSPLTTNLSAHLSKLGFAEFVSADDIREAALDAIFDLRPPASVLLPLLTGALNSEDETNRVCALYLLGAIGTGAEAAVPFLKTGLQSTNVSDRRAAAVAIGHLGLPVKAVIPELIMLIGAQDLSAARVYPGGQWQYPDTRIRAAIALGSFGTNAADAIPALLEIIREPGRPTWPVAASALLKVGCERSVLESELIRKMENSTLATRFDITLYLLRSDPTNRVALAGLMEIARSEPDYREWSIQELGKLGAAGEPAIPLLRELTTNDSRYVRTAASNALWRIELAVGTNGSDVRVVFPPPGTPK